MSAHQTIIRGLGACAVLWGIWFFTAVHAAPVSSDPDAKAKLETPAEKIRKALDKNISIKANNQPLTQAIAQIREQGKINIFIDRQSLQNFGLNDDVPVSVELDNVKMRTGLRTMLSQYNLGYAIVGSMLVITTEDMAIHRQMQQRVSVNYQDTPLRSALDQLARETAVNLIVDNESIKNIKKTVTLQLEDVPLDLTMRLIAEMADLNMVRVDNVIIVTDPNRAEKLRAELGNGQYGTARMMANPFGAQNFGGGAPANRNRGFGGVFQADDRGGRMPAAARKAIPQPPQQEVPPQPLPAPAPQAK